MPNSNNKKEIESELKKCCCSENKLESGNTVESNNEELIVTGKTKKRTEKEYKDLYNRLSRIEGQVRGVKKMVENEVYCVDILTQVSAITSALNSFNKVLLSNHIKSCVIQNVKEGNEEVIDELVKTIQKLMK
ncbi:metal-sensing transcriptional repressor [Lachnobacterium bovis]|uniref:DNA-binding transcriptional regulator, FrmR family n=1 Tax=Lachnobacterium bovis DSM 14045 TaxID=1122142 RepID=A0A1H3I8D7_9FIRM|nr:metal-sensing transcriptional repressor [Lachnobacterium bovis]SDY23725.1 DNA-binding transcriptional regulator, FrmR family [Lachnobacterium bovis DSM 14045]